MIQNLEHGNNLFSDFLVKEDREARARRAIAKMKRFEMYYQNLFDLKLDAMLAHGLICGR